MNTINKNSFNNKIFNRINNIIEDYNLIEDGELIAIALSGGKDSVLTLASLSKFQENSEIDFDLVTISVDEGIKGYREHGLEVARASSEEFGVKLIEKSIEKEFGFTLDEIYFKFKSACIPCGVFRRNILNKTAYELKANKIATGHNLDDEIQSFLMSFIRADTVKFAKFGPKLDAIHPKLIPRIKPLWNTPEKEVGMWAVLNNKKIHLDECPYSTLSLRSKIKGFLNHCEDERPGTKTNILESFKKNLNFPKQVAKLNECTICKEPTSGKTCKTCEIVAIIKEEVKN
ncbi:MAG: TIGR00269 family protein [Methanobacteriaceae archaeon]